MGAEAERWSDLARAFRELGQYEDAVWACRSALQLDPSDAETWHRLGVALLLLWRDDEGEQAFRRVLALDGGHTRARYNLGTLLWRTSPEEAREHLAVLRRQDPDLARLLEGQR